MHKGRVRFFNDIIGTGFIKTDDYPGIIKFSYKEIKKTGYRIVCENQQVLFDVYDSIRGPVAVNIIPVEVY